jgi:hypothetical protein
MPPLPAPDLLSAHDVFVKKDNPFQRTVRLRQALWREKQSYPIGLNDGRPLGTRLRMPDAKQQLWNYLTEGIREVVRAEVIDGPAIRGRLFKQPRIFDDLLSSQPLCFNLFGELKRDLPFATRVLQRLVPGAIASVRRIELEHSPGRGNAKYSADNSAFDVYVEYDSPSGSPGFFGIEVKYHENLRDKLADHRPRYDQIAQGMGCFHAVGLVAVREKPINQLWRDHMLAGSMLLADGWKHGTFVVLYPAENIHAAAAVEKYRSCLAETSTFDTWTLEAFIAALEAETTASWATELRARYLG